MNDRMAVVREMLTYISSGQMARDHWDNRGPMTQTERDEELARCERMIARNREVGEDQGVQLWIEHRDFILDFYERNRAA
ncbi:MAG: hypothetical protein JHD02_07040 [Thermoleophilaceae bacterium]|nr:hypothetical protein [Thermoleophilaceae bacterium]